uniref:C-type lectin domain-containing protein n=1 Tax=Cyprinus carpio TaxID=7962 RepID=A0A8C2PRN8_CYPCA
MQFTLPHTIKTKNKLREIKTNRLKLRHGKRLEIMQKFMSYLVVFIDGWKYYQSSLYFISSEMKSWTESRRYCRERAAELIIINNTEEQDFVKIISGTSDSFWIGLTDIEVEGRWKWVDGSTLSSGFWGSTEPNGRANEEDCALNHLPGWADYPCDYMSKWICEKSVFK